MRLAIYLLGLLAVVFLASPLRAQSEDLTVTRTWTNFAGEVIEGQLLDVSAQSADILCEGQVYEIRLVTFKAEDRALLRAEYERRHPSIAPVFVTPQTPPQPPQPDPYAAHRAAEERARLEQIARQRHEWASAPAPRIALPTPYQAGRYVGYAMMVVTALVTIKKVFFD